MEELQLIQDKYTRNVNMLPWTPQLKAQASTQVKNAEINIESSLNTGTSLVESVVKGVTGSQEQLDRSRVSVQQGITSVQNTATDTAGRIQKILIDPIQTQIETVKAQIALEKGKQSKADVVYKIRKEQTTALTNKYAANLHTSLLGLWRPLQDQTRAILATTAVVFGLLTVVIFVYFSYGAVVGLAAGRGGGSGAGAGAARNIGSLTNYMNNIGQETNDAIRNFVGGVRSRK